MRLESSTGVVAPSSHARRAFRACQPNEVKANNWRVNIWQNSATEDHRGIVRH